MLSRSLRNTGATLLFAIMASVFLVAPAISQPIEKFYADKSVRLIVGSSAGGGYDLYARVLARHMGRHIPGKPNIVIENMPGAGGARATNYVYEVAPKDGTVIGMPFYDQPVRQFIRPQGIRFDMRKVGWIGNMAELTGVIAVFHTAPAKTLEDAKANEVVMGSTGIADETYVMPQLMNALIGTRFRIVSGYAGNKEVTVAMERGEVHGRGGSWISWKVLNPALVEANKIRILVQAGPRRDPDLPDVPLITEFTRNPEDLAVLRSILTLPIGFSRAIITPPGVPAERIEALRRSFDAAMADPALLAEAKSRSMSIRPSTGEQVEAAVAEISATPDAVFKRAKDILGYK